MSNKIVVGADEAGRGLIIGPMVIGAVALDAAKEKQFEKFGIKDSKKYTSHIKLIQHAQFIKNNALGWSVKVLSAEVLNNFNKNGMTMDEAEAFAFFRAIEDISKKVPEITVYQVDKFQAEGKLRSLLKEKSKLKHIKLNVSVKADAKYISVGAGSILAREKSLHELDKIRKKYGEFGSGSTSDKRTISWLKNYYMKKQTWPAKIVRTYWKTIAKIEKELKG